MHPQHKKIYVAVGNEQQDGFKTLEWALKKWKPHPISIVLLHISSNFVEEFVYTPFGRLPARSVSEEKLELVRKEENEKIDLCLNKYKAFCGKVKVEILKVQKNDKSLHGFIVDLISENYITNLVIGLTFTNFSSWRSRSAISGSFFIHRNKPSFCEFFIVCGGKQVFLRLENDERIMEDDQGVTITKMKDRVQSKSWLERIFSEKTIDLDQLTSTSDNASNLRDQWEVNAKRIEDYFQYLLCFNFDEVEELHHENDTSQASPLDSEMQELAKSNMNIVEKLEYLRRRINEARDKIQCHKKEAKINSERHAKADWAIFLCNRRAEELEALSKEESMIRNELKIKLDTTKEQLHEVTSEIEETKTKLITVAELQSDISNKMRNSILAKSEAESQLEKAIATREDMVKDIEELRQQRDVIRRRIEFCREKEAIELVNEMNEMSLSCSFREYTAEEVRLATDNFSERLRLKSGGDWTSFYKGRLNHGCVAIKIFNSFHELSGEDFQVKVNFLGNIRHPNLIAMMGFCCEPRCIVFEFMQNGSISDMLFSPKRNQTLKWHDRIRIAAQVCSGVIYLHKAQPKPIVHGCLTPSNILLDRHLNAKVSGFGLTRYFEENCVGSDIRAFGILLLHLLTGRNWTGLVMEEMLIDKEALVHVLDDTAGPWPLDLVGALAGLAFRCLSINQWPKTDLGMLNLMEELEELKKKTDELVSRGEFESVSRGEFESQSYGGEQKQDSDDAPSVFLCPIFKEVMKNPYIAADGFSYEKEAIEEWLRMGRDASPMTNLKLNHKFLTPNHTIRAFIEDWHN